MTSTGKPIRNAAFAAAACAIALCSSLALAQAFPAKPITLVVPNPPGGFVDASARILSDSLAKVIGQSVVIDNKGGGSGNVAYGFAARAAPDGYTLVKQETAFWVKTIKDAGIKAD